MSKLPAPVADAAEHVASDSWVTPRWLAELVGPFDLDPATNSRSHIVASKTYQLERGEDGLTSPWTGSVWCNGPYSQPLPWCRRLAGHSGPWCALWKLDTTTEWFATMVDAGASWAPFRDRLRFERPDKAPLTANFASVLVWRDWTVPVALRPYLWLRGEAARINPHQPDLFASVTP